MPSIEQCKKIKCPILTHKQRIARRYSIEVIEMLVDDSILIDECSLPMRFVAIGLKGEIIINGKIVPLTGPVQKYEFCTRIGTPVLTQVTLPLRPEQ